MGPSMFIGTRCDSTTEEGLNSSRDKNEGTYRSGEGGEEPV